MIKVREVDALPEHKLRLVFSDGTKGTANLAPLLSKRPFAKLKDPKVFAEAYVDVGAVEWPCGVGIATEALYAMVHGLAHPETVEAAKANELEMSLREFRRVADATQAQVAETLGLNQSALSHFERVTDHKVSTLRDYVRALGGDLEIWATLGDKRVKLNGV